MTTMDSLIRIVGRFEGVVATIAWLRRYPRESVVGELILLIVIWWCAGRFVSRLFRMERRSDRTRRASAARQKIGQ